MKGGKYRERQRGGGKGRKGLGDLEATVEDAHARMREVLGKEAAEARGRGGKRGGSRWARRCTQQCHSQILVRLLVLPPLSC